MYARLCVYAYMVLKFNVFTLCSTAAAAAATAAADDDDDVVGACWRVLYLFSIEQTCIE